MSRILIVFLVVASIMSGKLEATSVLKEYNVTYGDWKTISGVKIKDGYLGSVHFFATDQTVFLNSNLDTAYSFIVNFEDKCNNEKKSRRTLTNKIRDCRFHSINLVESKIIRDIKKTYVPFENEIDRYLVLRLGHNRVSFAFYDLIIVLEKRNSESKREMKIFHFAIPDSEVAKYIDNYVKFDNAFAVMDGVYTIREIENGKTEFNYQYVTGTDNWFLRKLTGTLYDAIAEGTLVTVTSVVEGVNMSNASKDQVQLEKK